MFFMVTLIFGRFRMKYFFRNTHVSFIHSAFSLNISSELTSKLSVTRLRGFSNKTIKKGKAFIFGRFRMKYFFRNTHVSPIHDETFLSKYSFILNQKWYHTKIGL